ncbi:hypothetical protein COR24_19195 [Vibrio cholerae]|nr:hypothetical protein [Vibrio cholerae]EGR5456886.1 hypothetical protein [Vibrio cholerae]EGR5464519.1 hypothetical protein [Vibrio cholerae]
MVSASFGHFKSPLGWRFDLIIWARRLECGVYDALTFQTMLILFQYSFFFPLKKCQMQLWHFKNYK